MKGLFLFVLLFVAFASCKKETERIDVDTIEEFFPLRIGSYIIYDLDSILFTNFGQTQTVISYQIKDKIEDTLTDNAGRKSYRIVRYIRSIPSENWRPNNSFLATNTHRTLEYLENNLRYIKLAEPIKSGFSWPGNTYMDTYPLDRDLRYLSNWQYTYDSVHKPATILDEQFENTITVRERDEFLGQPPSAPGTQYAEKTFSVSKYAKGIGMIYREFLHWEYQGGQPGRPAYYTGYGIVQRIRDHH